MCTVMDIYQVNKSLDKIVCGKLDEMIRIDESSSTQKELLQAAIMEIDKTGVAARLQLKTDLIAIQKNWCAVLERKLAAEKLKTCLAEEKVETSAALLQLQTEKIEIQKQWCDLMEREMVVGKIKTSLAEKKAEQAEKDLADLKDKIPSKVQRTHTRKRASECEGTLTGGRQYPTRSSKRVCTTASSNNAVQATPWHCAICEMHGRGT